MKFYPNLRNGILQIKPTTIYQVGNFTVMVTLTDDNPMKPAHTQYNFNVEVKPMS
jgi:hypothetical protein